MRRLMIAGMCGLMAGCAGFEAWRDPPIATDSPVSDIAEAVADGASHEAPNLSQVQRMLDQIPHIDHLGDKVDDLNASGSDVNADPWAQVPADTDTEGFADAARRSAAPK